jgi:hypothetical protein
MHGKGDGIPAVTRKKLDMLQEDRFRAAPAIEIVVDRQKTLDLAPRIHQAASTFRRASTSRTGRTVQPHFKA